MLKYKQPLILKLRVFNHPGPDHFLWSANSCMQLQTLFKINDTVKGSWQSDGGFDFAHILQF